MNIVRPICAPILLTFAVSVLVGCQGIQGVRYHGADLEKVVGEDGALMANGGFDVGMPRGAEQADDGSVPAPHPRFHPVPTRPVFEAEGIVAASAVQELPPSQAEVENNAEPQSVLRTRPNSNVVVASGDVTSLPSELLVEEANGEAGEFPEVASEQTTSRRKVADVEQQPKTASVASAAVNDEPPAFTPVEVETPSTNDMWRPRVAAP